MIMNRIKLKNKYGNEKVYVVPYNKVNHIPDQFTPIKGMVTTLDALEVMGTYVNRYDAEGNPSMQQIIPYVLVQRKKDGKFFVTERLSGDQRLKGSLSIGIGGHIDKEDGYYNLILTGMKREVNEEVEIKEVYDVKSLGFMRDMKSSTNDHLGCIFMIEVSNCKVLETDKLRGMWYTYDELERDYAKFEGWGRHIIDHMLLNGKDEAFNKGCIEVDNLFK